MITNRKVEGRRLATKTMFHSISLLLLFCLNVAGQMQSPFSVKPNLARDRDKLLLSVSFSVKKGTYLYKEQLSIELPEGIRAIESIVPPAHMKQDQFLEKEVAVYDHDINIVYVLDGVITVPLAITIGYQGCDEALCYMPEKKSFLLDFGGGNVSSDGKPVGLIPEEEGGYAMVARAAGYLNVDDFLGFLDNAEAGKGMSKTKLKDIAEKRGIGILVIIVLLGGLSLNLTPCVLPMIPVNLAIIGAGVGAGSRLRGFALGGAYGAGIALVYGMLGALFVLTGTRLGALNASPVFNIAIGLVFLLLSLAMFGVFNLDLTRFQGRADTGGKASGHVATAFVMGSIAALLAGACVAPVVISVLVFALDLYNRGSVVAILMPFLLGLGMALPWPFAGAGLSVLPKAGRWMEKTKYIFGAVILIAAIYYGGLGLSLLRNRSVSARNEVVVSQEQGTKAGWYTSLDEALKAAQSEKKPVFIDFWASWCKNCIKMEKTTFRDPEVIRRLDAYVKVRYRAENQREPAVRVVLEKYVNVGLPTYVILKNAE